MAAVDFAPAQRFQRQLDSFDDSRLSLAFAEDELAPAPEGSQLQLEQAEHPSASSPLLG